MQLRNWDFLPSTYFCETVILDCRFSTTTMGELMFSDMEMNKVADKLEEDLTREEDDTTDYGQEEEEEAATKSRSGSTCDKGTDNKSAYLDKSKVDETAKKIELIVENNISILDEIIKNE